MFVDEVYIKLKAGKGGDGVVSFRREKYVPRGGPDGGDGGRGGHIVLKVNSSLNTLSYFRNRKEFYAEDGGNGAKKNSYGANGRDLILDVPQGTLVYDKNKELLADLVEVGEEFVIARGGQGGRGNAKFASSTHQVPRRAEKGLIGEEKNLFLELKLLAEVGLVGLPNAGKSTLLSRVSNTKPKIADYPFTTLQPLLGVVGKEDGQEMVWADLPGLIEGAHKGVGLGHRFLKHIERTRVLLHLVDGSGLQGEDPWQGIEIIENELGAYKEVLKERPRLIVINKIDLTETKEGLKELEGKLRQAEKDYTIISAVTGEGIPELIRKVAKLLEDAPVIEKAQVVHRFEITQELPPFILTKENNVYVVSGGEAQKVIDRTDFTSPEGVQNLLNYLRKKGLYDVLKEKGLEDGASVRIGEMEFEYLE